MMKSIFKRLFLNVEKKNFNLEGARRIIFHPEYADYNAAINYRMLIYLRPLSLYQLSHAYEQSDSGWNMSGKMRHHYLDISIFYVIAVFLW